MTDAIDIKALRCQAETAIVCGGMFAISGEQALSLLDQLEAERQLAEKLRMLRDSWRESAYTNTHRAEKAEAELAALKSDQVPVAVLYKTGDVLTREECADDRIFAICCKVETPLFTVQQKPAEYFRAEGTAQIAAVKRLDTTPLNKVFTANAILRVMYDINRCVEKREDK